MRVGLLWHGDAEALAKADLATSRFANIAAACREQGAEPVAIVHSDETEDLVRPLLLSCDCVQAWVNPFEQGTDRSRLNALLRSASAEGVVVSAHPDTIEIIGTKEVLWTTREMSWSTDVALYRTHADLVSGLPERLRRGARVLKARLGQSGSAVWRVEESGGVLRVRHAQRGAVETTMDRGAFFAMCEALFAGGESVVDQGYQERLPEGMVRCYMVVDKIEGFGHQAVNALFPAEPGAKPESAPQPGPRLYHPPSTPEFQRLKAVMEAEWLSQLCDVCGVRQDMLPLLWDADFLLGPKNAQGDDTYVLCEINVSAVSPYPESCAAPFAKAAVARANAHL